MREAGDAPALISPDGSVATYAELVAAVDRFVAVTADLRGPVAIDGDGADAVAALLAIVTTGRVAVPLFSWPAATRRARAEQAGALALLTTRGGDLAVEPLSVRGPTVADGGAVVLFTSGTSGKPRAALYPLDALAGRFRRARSTARRLSVFHLDHVGGLSLLLRVLAAGGSLVLPPEPPGPDAIGEAIERHRVEVLVASPTLLRLLLLSSALRDRDLSSLTRVVWSSEPLPAPVLAALQRALPHVAVEPSYGLTELGVLATAARPGDPSWFRLVDVPYRVVDGRLWLRSVDGMTGYLDEGSPFDPEGWYDTGDRVETDGPYLRVLGRTSDLINVGGVKVVPQEIESALLGVPNVTGAVVRGRPNAVTGQVVVADVTVAAPEDHHALRGRIHTALRDRLDAAALPVWIDVVDELPITPRAKLQRAEAP